MMQNKLKINILNFRISNEHFRKIGELGGSPEFMSTIHPTLLNLKDEEKTYDMNEMFENTRFLHKYYYSMNNLLHCLNNYLLDIYFYINKDEPKSNWESIYNKRNTLNTIVNLFSYVLIKKNIHTSQSYKLLSKLYVYENLYRNQLSHGWMNVFKNINIDMMEKTTLKNPNQYPLKNNKEADKIILASMNTQDLDDLRKSAKEFNVQQVVFGKFVPYNKDLDYVLYEPIVQINIKNDNLKNLIEEELKNEGQDISLINNLEEMEDNEEIVSFSLNNLIRTILETVEMIEYTPPLKEQLKEILKDLK